MKHCFVELVIVAPRGERKFVRCFNEEFTIGTSVDCDVTIDDSTLIALEARFVCSGSDELILELTAPTDASIVVQLDDKLASPPLRVRPGQRLSFGNTFIAWRWLPKEEWPTIAGDPPSPRESQTAALELAGEVNNGRYQRGSEVGRGGVGKVLEALEKPLHRSVALKVLLDRGEDEDQHRFIREARITGQLEHPSIVPVHELNVDESGHIFYTMKLVKGVTLLQVLRDLTAGKPDARRYTLPPLLTAFQKVCDAVAFAHGQRDPIIHRDLKPQNIMLGDYGEVLVMDWGAAKILGTNGQGGDIEVIPSEVEGPRAETFDVANRNRFQHVESNPEDIAGVLMTRPGSVMGTPGYMAPEQARGRAAAADERTDIYALGGILYAILTLEAPVRMTYQQAYDFETRAEIGGDSTDDFHKSVAPLLRERSRRRKLDHLPGRTVPDSLVAVALKAMALRPRDRFASVKELQADIAAYQAGRATSAEEARAWKRFRLLVARNKVLFSAIAATFVILLAATAVSLHQRETALASNRSLQTTLQRASFADHEAARQRFRAGAWREGLALMGRSLAFWPGNREAANYLLSAIVFGHGDADKLPIFGVHHRAAIGEAAFSPDGRYFATASYDHTTCIWETATGRQVGQTLHHAGPCCFPCFSPDGRKLVTTGEDGVAMLWDTQTGERLAPPMRHGRPDLDSLSIVVSAVFSPNGKQILTGSLDHTARVWDALSGKEIAQLVNPHRVADAVFSPDGSRIVTSYWYGGAMLWDATTFQPIGPPMEHGATVRKALFTPDGNRIVTSSLDHTARIWDGHTAEPLTPPLHHPDVVWTLDMSSDGKLFATAGSDKTVRLWSVDDGSAVGVPMEHEAPVNTVAFSPNGERLVSASRDKTVRLWDTATCKQLGNPMRHDETVMRAIFTPDATGILSAGWDGVAYLWNADVPGWPGEVMPVPGQVRSIEFDANDDRVFVATRDGQAGLWSLRNKEFVTPITHHRDAIATAAFHSKTRQFATAGTDGTLRFWDVVSGKQIGQTKGEDDTIVAIAFSVDGESLFAAYLGGSVIQLRVPDGIQIGKVMKHSEKMDALAVAPSGRELATGSRDDYVHFWETSGGNPLPRSLRHGNPVLAISYHPDGHSIATGCDDHTARIWSLDRDEQSGEPFALNGRGTAVRYTAGGNALLVGGIEDTEVNYYDTKTRNALVIPLPHPTGVSQIASNASGSLVVTVTNDGVARLWPIPNTSDALPKWLPEYLRALAGIAFSSGQQLVQVPTRERLALRAALLAAEEPTSAWRDALEGSFTEPPPRK